jgi:uncharacterized protein (DUF2147 family)
LKRNENDAAALQAKVAAKKAAASESTGTDSGNTGTGTVIRKKVPAKKVDTFNDLLEAGLKKSKVSAK